MNKYILMADDDTFVCSCSDIGPLITEANAIVKSGDYSYPHLGIYTLSHDFVLPKKPELKLRRVK